MTPAARLSAAIEVLADIEGHRRPAADALKDWGLAHRFAGSGDRSAIGTLVYDTLRRRSSAAALMGREGPRATLIGALRLARGWSPETISGLFSGERFAPSPLTDEEQAALGRDADAVLAAAPPWVAGDYPQWLDPALAASFGESRVAEARAMAERAPVDLRVNTLRCDRETALADLAPLGAVPTPLSPLGLRIAIAADGRAPAIQAEPAFQRGFIEIQDEGSQIAGLLAGAKPGTTVVDLCAGGGGKTLELAAAMRNEGILYATDSDKRRLAPIWERLTRAGISIVEVRHPRGRSDEPLSDIGGKADLIVVDAPCTGTGTWRRNPDAKWRVRPSSLEGRIADQATVLDRAARLVKPGGRIAYITCSVLRDENDDAVAAFLERNDGFARVAPAKAAAAAGLDALANRTSPGGHGLQLTPLRTGTDGFFFALLRRS
ncbi:MAG: RsmB/NOP family class I SAM-dependent RNA methyltransferase [Burkholderiales bacterium]|nr:RsmB/NOP family class I SAM-dependent RNA methyltransferase [Burkholderiales bacterium]